MDELHLNTTTFYECEAKLNRIRDEILSTQSNVNAAIKSIGIIESSLTFYDEKVRIAMRGVPDLAQRCWRAVKWLDDTAIAYENAEMSCVKMLDKATRIFIVLTEAEIKTIAYESFLEIEKENNSDLQNDVFSLLDDPRFNEERWNNSTQKEREEMLNEYLAIILSIMGLDNTESELVFSDDMKHSTTGSNTYNKDSKRCNITINSDYLNDPDGYEIIIETVIHEARHSYQRDAVDNPKKYDNVLTDETIKAWEYSFDNYSNDKGYEWYVNQSVEYDAKNFARQEEDLIPAKNPVYEGGWDGHGNVI